MYMVQHAGGVTLAPIRNRSNRRMRCNFVVEPEAGVDDRHFSSSPQTENEVVQ